MSRPTPLTLSRLLSLGILATLLLVACASRSDATSASGDRASGDRASGDRVSAATPDTVDPARTDTAVFAGGCFWCMEPPYDRIDGVLATVSGFSGGDEVNPTYDEVAYGRTGHTEVVQVVYDTSRVDYAALLDVYWRNVDPLDGTGQFCDRGQQYRPEIFVRTKRQRQQALASKARVAERFDAPIAVDVVSLEAFYPAEEYHQNFYQKNPDHYKRYRSGCGRDARIEALWGASSTP